MILVVSAKKQRAGYSELNDQQVAQHYRYLITFQPRLVRDEYIPVREVFRYTPWVETVTVPQAKMPYAKLGRASGGRP